MADYFAHGNEPKRCALVLFVFYYALFLFFRHGWADTLTGIQVPHVKFICPHAWVSIGGVGRLSDLTFFFPIHLLKQVKMVSSLTTRVTYLPPRLSRHPLFSKQAKDPRHPQHERHDARLVRRVVSRTSITRQTAISGLVALCFCNRFDLMGLSPETPEDESGIKKAADHSEAYVS